MLSKNAWLKKLKPVFENADIKKTGHNLKFDIEVMGHAGVDVQGIEFDTMVASYLTNPGTRQHNLDSAVFSEFGYQMQPITDLIGKGKSQISLADVDVKRVSFYSCEDADFTQRLIAPLTRQLKEVNNLGLLKKLEIPLIPVLAAMERHGVKIDKNFLGSMSKEITSDIRKLEKHIFQLTKTEFNIRSPIQLKEVLFEKLKISSEGLGKTKTGVSTSASELEKIRFEHPVIEKILMYRELTKLKSTYLDALPELVSKADKRVHTSFNQTITATGRLSSSDPNLQNIPIRTDVGKKIRRSFIAERGYGILTADYSQIELRIVASLAKDKKMIQGFRADEDIHTRTAAEINGVPPEKVTKPMRRAAKAVNFGILYGMGAFGLAVREGISRTEAKEFIDTYFKLHREIRNYIEDTKITAAKFGYVETLFGRRRYLPDINSNIHNIKAAAERMAINHPVQGTAADLIKLAMIEVHKKLPDFSQKVK